MSELEIEPITGESDNDRTERQLFTVTLLAVMALLVICIGMVAIAYARGR